MTDASHALAFDRRSVELIGADVARLTDDDLRQPTPCDGWDVAALLRHMNVEHAAICGGDVQEHTDPRREFAIIVRRWLEFFAANPATVIVPKMNATLPTDMVLFTHATDMVVHRWDLGVAVGRTIVTPADLLEEAHGVADFVTAPGSSLVGPGGVYKPAVSPVPGDAALDGLVRKFGRDPHWRPTG